MEMIKKWFLGLILALQAKAATCAKLPEPKPEVQAVQRVFVVVLENTNADKARRQPFLKSLMAQGAYLNNFHAEAHPSQGNYVALIAGDLFGISDDGNVDLDVKHLGDLLEAKGKSWKAYAEDFPGGCFLGEGKRLYARKHVPFMSMTNVTRNVERCKAHVVDGSQLDADISAGHLADFSLYIPNLDNDGHDTGVEYADQWLGKTFGPRLQDQKFMQGTLFIVTFDENSAIFDRDANLIYTVLVGGGVKAGAVSDRLYSHYSLLRLIEDKLGVENLGRNDVTTNVINDVF